MGFSILLFKYTKQFWFVTNDFPCPTTIDKEELTQVFSMAQSSSTFGRSPVAYAILADLRYFSLRMRYFEISLFLVFWSRKNTKRISIKIVFVRQQLFFKRWFPDFSLNFRFESSHKIKCTIMINCLKVIFKNSYKIISIESKESFHMIHCYEQKHFDARVYLI